MKKYIRKNALKLGIIAAAVLLVVIISTVIFSGGSSFGAGFAGTLRAPVQRAASAMTEWVESLYGYIYKYDSLVAETEALRSELADAQSQLRTAAEALDENARLRNLLNLDDKYSSFVYESSKIVSWNSSNWASSFTLSKGSNSGLETGDCVITEYGVLIGQISELGPNWSTVRTTIDLDSNIGVLVGDAGNSGLVMGSYDLMKDGCAMLTYMTDSSHLRQGDSVITSGSAKTIPQGLVLGSVSGIVSEAGGQNVYGVIEPGCDFNALTQVFIITDFEIVE